MIILLPTLNEESGLKKILPKIKQLFKNSELLVVDGGSTDKTLDIAKRFGCKVMIQKGKGKGNAIIEALEKIDDNEIVAMLDADGTYEPADIKYMLRTFRKYGSKNTIIIGSRYAFYKKGSFKGLNLLGGMVLSFIASVLFLTYISDMLSGIRVFRAGDIKRLNLETQNFEIETEMTLKALKNGIKIVNVPCHYYERFGRSKLNPFKDGFLIFKRILIERLK